MTYDTNPKNLNPWNWSKVFALVVTLAMLGVCVYADAKYSLW
jgi:hypothetical protein